MKTSPSQEPAIVASGQHPGLISEDSLQEVCAANGPFVTAFLPACQPGAADLSCAERIRTVLRDAASELTRRRFLEPMDPLLNPLRELVRNPEKSTGSSGSVVFVSPSLFRHFLIGTQKMERLIVASHPHITPILWNLIPKREFYVLAITKKRLRLGEWRDGKCMEISMPSDISTSFEDTLLSKTPDHDLQSRSSIGSFSQGGPTRFGTSTERDEIHDHLRQYFLTVDRILTGFLNGTSLVLIGIAQEVSAYRSVARYPHLLSAKPTSPEHLSLAELGQYGQDAILEKRRMDTQKILRDLRETARRDHVATGIREVLEAAYEGRVHNLLIERNTEQNGHLGPLFPVNSSRIEGEQDLINAAAVETLRRQGDVYVVDPGQLGSCSIAAILRYSATPHLRSSRR